ncbi:MAG: hypothetical protein JWN05_2337 [Arthrobacter sp.]|jgi:hypothetical protein|nr:hypothetical protein [Arthrobacter sp.]
MAVNIFAITSYAYQVGYRNTATYAGITIQYQGRLSARGANGEQLTIYGLRPDSPVPADPYCNDTRTQGAIFVPFADLHNYWNIVRSEEPVYARLDLALGMFLFTGPEPAGEDEGS